MKDRRGQSKDRGRCRFVVAVVAAALAASLAGPASALADWSEPWNTATGGSLNFNPGDQALWAPSITNVGGTPWVAHVEAPPGFTYQTLYLRRWNGTNYWPTAFPSPPLEPIDTANTHPVSRPSMTGLLDAPWVAWDEYDPASNITKVYYAFEANPDSTRPFWLKRGGFYGYTSNGSGLNPADDTSPSITSVDYRCGTTTCGHSAYLAFYEPFAKPNGYSGGQLQYSSCSCSDISLVRMTDGGVISSIVSASRHIIDYAGPPNVTTVNNVPYVTWSHDGRMYVTDCGHLDSAGSCLSAGFTRPATVGTADDLDVPHLAGIKGLLWMTWIENVNGVPSIRVARRDDPSPHFTTFPSLNRDPGQRAANSSIASLNGVPVVAWQERDAATGIEKIYVDYYDGSGWQPYGSALNVNGRSGDLPDITAVGGTPYVAFYDVKSSSVIQLHVKANFFHVRPLVTRLAAASTRRGPVFTVGLDRKAKVRLDFLRTVPCRNKRRGCTRKIKVGSVTFRGHKGTNRFRFNGRIGGQKLAPGTYTVSATPITGRLAGPSVSLRVRL